MPNVANVLHRYCFEKYTGETCGECKPGLSDFPECKSAKYALLSGWHLQPRICSEKAMN